MIKLIKNAFGDLKTLIDGNGNVIDWGYIESLFKLQNDMQVRLGNKLTKSHIEYCGKT